MHVFLFNSFAVLMCIAKRLKEFNGRLFDKAVLGEGFVHGFMCSSFFSLQES